MNQPILEIKHLKKSYGQNEVLKDISLTIHKEKLFLSLEVPVVVNQPSYVRSTYLKHQLKAKSYITVKMSSKKAIISLTIEKN